MGPRKAPLGARANRRWLLPWPLVTHTPPNPHIALRRAPPYDMSSRQGSDPFSEGLSCWSVDGEWDRIFKGLRRLCVRVRQSVLTFAAVLHAGLRLHLKRPTSHVIGETLSRVPDHARICFANTHLAAYGLKARGAFSKNLAFRYAAATGAATGENSSPVLK